MSIFKETYTEPIEFKHVPYEVEFLRDNGQVWCKTSPDGATKVNAPFAGNITHIDRCEIVRLNFLDVPTGHIRLTSG